ncbi:hypothetical protein DRH13_02145 [Candidatus Woesebacteria bacterium]|nr:MAG: hypothetical protein DRH13_02145 [Candidatus Woesebacteria bacterium]
MKRLSKLFKILDQDGAPSCSKNLLEQIFRNNGKFEIPHGLMKTSTDSGPLVRRGFIKRNKNNKIAVTRKAKKLAD